MTASYIWRDPKRTSLLPPDLITAGDAAALLGVSSKTVSKWADAGYLTCYRGPGKRGWRRYRRSELQTVLESAIRPCRYQKMGGCSGTALPFSYICAAHTDAQAEALS
jgi:excisionase family DNA binding protein